MVPHQIGNDKYNIFFKKKANEIRKKRREKQNILKNNCNPKSKQNGNVGARCIVPAEKIR
jgi:hypothetical protein